MKRFVVYWRGQNIKVIPPAKVCALHRDMVVNKIKPLIPRDAALVVDSTSSGECALALQGGCGDS